MTAKDRGQGFRSAFRVPVGCLDARRSVTVE